MKKFLAAVLFAPLVALAQTYPSPTFQNLTVNGTATIATSALSGGSINSTTIGATTPSTGAFTTLSSTGLATLNGLSLTSPLAVASGGTNCAAASGTCVDNISGFSGTGFLQRTGANTYAFIADPLPVAHGGTGAATAGGTALDNVSGLSGTGIVARTGTATYAVQNLSGDCSTSGTLATTCSTTNGSPIVPTVSSISSLKALSTTAAAALGRVYVAGYYAATDAGGGYFTWNASSSTADNGGTFIQPSSAPASGRWVRDGYLAGRYTPAMFGSQANGTADDAAPIRAAMLALSGLTGGGTLQLTCNTTYNLASDAGNALRSIIYPYSNVNIVGCGPSSVLKVAAGMNNSSTGYFVIYPQDSSSSHPLNNVQFREFKIDDNGSNNSCTNTCWYNNVNIGAAYGDGILIDGVTVVNNPGSQNFSFGTTALSFPSIENVRIVNSRDENSCDLVNTACTDFSAIYLDVVNGVVANNTFYNSSQSSKNTAIEVHGFDISVTNNVAWNYNIGANIAGQNDNVTGVTMTGNVFLNVYTGVRLWANSGKIASNIVFANNSVLLTNETLGPAVDLDQDIVSGSNAEEITISGNTFVSGQSSGTTNIWGGVRLGAWVHQNIVGNTFRGFSGPAIYAGSTVGLTNSSVVNIADNTITDAGSTSTAASKVAIQMNNASNAASFSIHGNVIQSDTGYATTGIGGTGGAQVAGAVYGNVIGGAAITTAVNITGTNTKVGVTCSAGSPTSSYTSYMGVQTHC